MKGASKLVAVIGALLVLLSVVGRFWAEPNVCWFGQTFAAGSVLLLANTVLLAAVLMQLLGSPQK